MHIPSQNRHNLSKASGKEFEGLLKGFLACKDIPIMLEDNIAPQFGLFNGATCYFHGLLYLPDDLDVSINKNDFDKMKFKGMALESPFDLKGRGSSKYTQFHELPFSSILVSINGRP